MRVLIALDESSVSARAAREAARLFSAVPGAEFLVINVSQVAVPWVGAAGYGAVVPLDVDPRWAHDVGDDHDANLMERASSAGLPDAEVIDRTGEPVTEICAAADERDVDVIVVGSHDKTMLGRLLSPSVAAGVVRGTYRPVLVISGEPPPPRSKPL
jgi:nucleotide-binding universal stress UspA family protein